MTLVIFDHAGREVHRLAKRELETGWHQVTWQPRDLTSGTYFLGAGNVEAVKKCTLLK